MLHPCMIINCTETTLSFLHPCSDVNAVVLISVVQQLFDLFSFRELQIRGIYKRSRELEQQNRILCKLCTLTLISLYISSHFNQSRPSAQSGAKFLSEFSIHSHENRNYTETACCVLFENKYCKRSETCRVFSLYGVQHGRRNYAISAPDSSQCPKCKVTHTRGI